MPPVIKRRICIRVDEMGPLHAMNTACLRSCLEGVARSVEVMVPGPWFGEAAAMLHETAKEGRPVDCGIHLTLTSEYDAIKWRPLTRFPAVDGRGYFLRSALGVKSVIALKQSDIFDECAAQIVMGREALPNVTHFSAHMFAVPDPIMRQLSETFRLPCEVTGPKLDIHLLTLDGIVDGGFYHFHPLEKSPEIESLGEHLCERVKVTDYLCAPGTRRAFRAAGVEILSYAAFRKAFP